MPLQLEEVYCRSEQGVLKPFLCRAEDGFAYFVKGKGAGIAGLLAEFIGGRLAQLLGLPVPQFCIVEASPELVAACRIEQASDLGPGIGFASRQVEYVQEISASTLPRVPVELQQQVLAFDWWIRNEDRHFGAEGGNPNLLWDVRQKALVVIDHHAAFDKAFRDGAFWKSHIFCDQRPSFAEFEFQSRQAARFATALEHWDEIVACIPPDWLDYLRDFGGDFDIDGIRRMLERYRLPDFWTIP
jgi:hypothetical protein